MTSSEYLSSIMLRVGVAKNALEKNDPEKALEALREIEKLQQQLEDVAVNGRSPYRSEGL